MLTFICAKKMIPSVSEDSHPLRESQKCHVDCFRFQSLFCALDASFCHTAAKAEDILVYLMSYHRSMG